MRNPLATALWSAELLVRMSPPDRAGARGEKLAGMCLRTLTRLRTLLEDYFLAERVIAGGVPTRRELVEVATLEAALRDRMPQVSVVEGWGGGVIRADRSMVERAIEGMVWAAGRDGAQVKVSSGTAGGRTEFRVEGAPPLPRALELPDKTAPSDPSGHALGLVMAQGVARWHGGELKIDRGQYVLSLPSEPGGGAGEQS